MPALRISAAADADIAIGGPSEHPVEPSEESPNGPRLSLRGRNSKAASAGLNVKALNAEKITEMAMVTANCW